MPKQTRISSEDLAIINIKTTLSINETAIYADLGEGKVRQLVHTKDFPCFKNGNKWCINREMLNEWLKKISVEHRQI
ncbi:helix-turn-helix domain-containing protein [Clostridium estertheticum]|uniref:helix-turn-helix domain-containing protein n=1 Tax=Clostridium estertheticum TaxID=238834 RepID=UPI00124E6DA7|nr:helix-turn-helix domain-containing protein [Clostridium estertheticum]MBZ9615334.1 helix-turn-helix domain-containing protein [Clostridium estertheticum subsp. laramiense]WAG75223.1 helix-turn-helix domain-containing protein [Clostridium estertheticum]